MKNLITQNSKLKTTSKALKVKVYNFGITAYKTSKGKLTCPFADKCIKFCYAQKGAYIWSNVAKVFEERYEATKLHDFEYKMIEEITRKKVDYLRVHDSGDFYSTEYLYKWLWIANQLPKVKFYAYTNSIKMVKDAKNDLPNNFDFIFSDSGKQSHLIDTSKDRYTKIFKSKEDLLLNDFVDASKVDLYATKYFNPDNKKVGLVFH